VRDAQGRGRRRHAEEADRQPCRRPKPESHPLILVCGRHQPSL
jgi:hypothetical protein